MLFFRYITLAIFYLSCCSSSISLAQSYQIEATFEGLKDSVCYLSFYYENEHFVQDSAQIDAQGKVIFRGDTPLEPGLYNLMIGHWQSLDLLVTEQPFLCTFKANAKNILGTLVFTNSRENDLFYSYQKKVLQDTEKINALQGDNPAVVQQKQQLQYALGQYQQKFLKAFENTFAAKLIKAQLPLEVPQAIQNQDALAMNRFFVQHFFDNLDLHDERFIRTPYLHNALSNYFEPLSFLTVDSLNKLVDLVITKASPLSLLQKYLITKTASIFENSKTMGHDAVFVHILQQHYLKKPSLWDAQTLQLVQERVFYLEKLLLGKTIPELVLQDTQNRNLRLHEIPAKCTLLYIYAADCQHCQQFTPQLIALSQKYQSKGFKVLAAMFGNDLDTWKDFIQSFHTEDFINGIDPTGKVNFYQDFDAQFTPTIYILDEKKRIIGKGNLRIEAIESIVKQQVNP